MKILLCKNLLSILAIGITLLYTMTVVAEELEIMLTAECTTKETGVDGVRHSCDSDWQFQTVPDGYVIVEKSLNRVCTSCNGSENNCDAVFDDMIEVIPGTGILQPRTLKVRARARGPKGHAKGRGWSKCKFTAKYVKYK